MAVRLSALRTGRTLLPRNIIILMFLVLISDRFMGYNNIMNNQGENLNNEAEDD
jgi:hypothetical protein